MRRLFLTLLTTLPLLLNGQMSFDSLILVQSYRIYFDLGQDQWQEESAAVLSEVSEFFAENPRSKIHLTAHTDSIGTDDSNQGLSDRRANTVLNGLIEQGVPAEALVIETFGESIPEADNRTEEGRQQNRRVTIDCYISKPMTYLTGKIRDEESGEGIPAELRLRGEDYEDSFQTEPDGTFKHAVPDQKVITVDILSKGYFLKSKTLKTRTDIMLHMALPQAAPGKVADIPDLLFVGNKAILLRESERILPMVYAFMKMNPDLVIEIGGHINRPNQPPVSRESWHYELSRDRAKTIFDYLLANQIDPKRVSFKGYGNWKMRFPKARSAGEQQQNRRVEIRVTGILGEEK
ncbi:MAG: OmpA family protein [Saprospiraceae bacterium]|nr:OmpA family protein [Saprospiraceae bacterium]